MQFSKVTFLNLLRMLSLLFLATSPGLAQDRGSISGTITDASGAAVPGATITLNNPATGLSQTFVSSASGGFSFQSLPVGQYTITIEKEGFRKIEHSLIAVQVDTDTRVDDSMEVGQVQQTVNVQGAVSMLQTDRSDLGQVIERRAIETLPLFSSGGMRSNMAFTLLVPGVRTDLSQDIDEGGSPVIGGGTGGSNTEYLVDGGDTESPRRNEPQVRVLSVEGMEEFKVQTGAYSAEYGRTSNGILNYTTKSGTNDFSGSLVVQIRNQALNANGFFYSPPAAGEETVHNQNTEAASFGGPVLIPKLYNGRNKAFFFFSGERSRAKDIESNALEDVPTAAAREGNFSGYTGSNGNMIPIYNPFDGSGNVLANANLRVPFPGNIIPPSMINPVAAALLSYEPLPENPNSFFNNNPVINTGQRDPGENEGVYTIKGDYIASEKLRFSGFFTRQYFNGCNICLGPLPGPEAEAFQENYDNRYIHFNTDYIFTPSLLSHFNFSFDQRNGAQIPNIRLGPNTGPYGVATEIPGVPTYNDSPLYSSYETQNYENFNTQKYDSLGGMNIGIAENLAWVHGKHTVKWGFQYLRQNWYNDFCNNCGGTATFTSAATGNPSVSGTNGLDLASFLLGVAATGSFAYYSNPNFVYPYYAAYIQDDIKLSKRLTVNIGLRYDLPLAKREAHDQNSQFDPNMPNPGAGNLLGALIFAGSGPGRSGLNTLLQERLLAFGPRAGVAYSLTSKTVLRAGGAIYYDSNKEDGSSLDSLTGFGGTYTTPANYFSTGVSMLMPNSSNGAIAGLLPFQAQALAIKPPIISPTLSNYQSPAGYYSDGKAGQYYDYNFTLEQSINQHTLLRASFHASYGNEIRSTEQYNQLNPKYIPIYGNLLTQPLSSLTNSSGAITNPILIANGFQLPYAGYPLIETLANALSPYPQYGSITGTTNGGHSTYNALESGLSHNFSNGFFAQVSYTFSKWLSDNTSPNVFAENREKDLNIADRPHIISISYIYELPFGKGRRFGYNMNPAANAVLGGWRASAVQIYQSGAPIGVMCSQTLYGAGVARCDVHPGVPLINPNWNPANGSSPYLNPAAFYQPPTGVFGNTSVYIPGIRNPWQLNEDVALSKIFNLRSDKRTLEFRASAYNAADRHLLGTIGTSVGVSNFGEFTNPQYNLPRNVEFMLRFKF